MIKGGYKIVNFNGAALSGTPETLAGIYDQIVDDYDKPVMVSGVSLNGDIMDDAYAGVQEKVAGDLSKSVELTVYGGIITVTEDDEVSFVLSKTTAELQNDISDLQGDLEMLEDMSHVLIQNNSDIAVLNAKLVDDQVIPCAMSNTVVNSVFGFSNYGYGLGIRIDSGTFVIFMKASTNIITGSFNINTNAWSSLTKTQLTPYTP